MYFYNVTQTLLAAPPLWNIQLLSTIKQLQKVHEGHPPGAAIFWRRNFHELVLAGWNLMLPFHDLSTMALSTSFSFASTHQHVVSEARDHNRKSFAEIFEPPKLTQQGSSYKFCFAPRQKKTNSAWALLKTKKPTNVHPINCPNESSSNQGKTRIHLLIFAVENREVKGGKY